MVFKYIEPLYFFLALGVGLFLTYVMTPPPDIIIKYPTPENAGSVIYRDTADVCYKYRAEEVDCPEDETKIKEMDIQDISGEKKESNVFDMVKTKFFE